MANPYLEVQSQDSGSRITCIGAVEGAVTKETWKTRAKARDRFVKIDATTSSQGGGHMTVEFVANNDANALGRLLSAKENSDGQMILSVEIDGTDVNAAGGATGALAAGDIGKRLLGAADGKLKISGDTTGFGRVVGGTKATLRVRHSWL